MPEKKRKVVWYRVARLLATAFVGLSILGLFAAHVTTLRQVQNLGKEEPSLFITPTPIQNTAIADTTNWPSHSLAGIVLRTPETWHDELDRGFQVTVGLGEHGRLLALTHTLSNSTQDSHRNYDYVREEMNTTPNQAGLLRTSARNAKVLDFVDSKTIDAMKGTTSIHPITFGNWRGFQVEMTKNQSHTHRLILFDVANHRIDLFISSTSPTDFPQPELNAIVASLEETKSPGCTTPGCS